MILCGAVMRPTLQSLTTFASAVDTADNAVIFDLQLRYKINHMRHYRRHRRSAFQTSNNDNLCVSSPLQRLEGENLCGNVMRSTKAQRKVSASTNLPRRVMYTRLVEDILMKTRLCLSIVSGRSLTTSTSIQRNSFCPRKQMHQDRRPYAVYWWGYCRCLQCRCLIVTACLRCWSTNQTTWWAVLSLVERWTDKHTIE